MGEALKCAAAGLSHALNGVSDHFAQRSRHAMQGITKVMPYALQGLGSDFMTSFHEACPSELSPSTLNVRP